MEKVKTTKVLNVSYLKDLIERRDANGNRIPFSVCYACQNGTVIDTGEEKSAICVGVDTEAHTHTLSSVHNNKYFRKVRDVLFLRVDDTKIVVS